ncbi:hypothetical protein BLNAU_13349 [Blattamonas nauphoetae]|uniref:Uncharacterized protein n=1 Tax=Blattamonas nauphoetae TaxID=2049346 RepID=A0ABQ9XK16_9EUKA|nr:hypothetical protein BLNAU_13349 [Blattamonas nauphoetae]
MDVKKIDYREMLLESEVFMEILRKPFFDDVWIGDWASFGHFFSEDECSSIQSRWETPIQCLVEISTNPNLSEQLLGKTFAECIGLDNESLSNRIAKVLMQYAGTIRWIVVDGEGYVTNHLVLGPEWNDWQDLVSSLTNKAVQALNDLWPTPYKCLLDFATYPTQKLSDFKQTLEETPDIGMIDAQQIFQIIKIKVKQLKFLRPSQDD